MRITQNKCTFQSHDFGEEINVCLFIFDRYSIIVLKILLDTRILRFNDF